MEALSSNGYGPKVIVSDKSTFRAEEFMKGCQELQVSELMEEQIVNQIVRILISYSLFSNVQTYYLCSDQLSTDYNIKINEGKNITGTIKKNIYDMCTKSMFNKAKKNFQKFSSKFKERFDKIVESDIYNKFKKIKFYLKNYKDMFNKVFPKEALMVLNHNDVHRLNILSFDKGNLMLIDHEYAALNLVGIDIVNYLLETSYDYKNKSYPFFTFDGKLNYDKMFVVYQQFLDKFEKDYKTTNIVEESNEKLIEQCRTKEYFLKLICVISLFWFMYSVIYLYFNVFSLQKSFDHVSHALCRLWTFEQTFSILESKTFF